MQRNAFGKGQITCALKPAEMSATVAKCWRRSSISEQTFYPWKKKHGRFGIAEVRRDRTRNVADRHLQQLTDIPADTMHAWLDKACTDTGDEAGDRVGAPDVRAPSHPGRPGHRGRRDSIHAPVHAMGRRRLTAHRY